MTNEKTEKTAVCITAAAGGDNAPVRVAGRAYSGGKMRLEGWKYPAVVDLQGMELPETVPLLLNHENRTAARAGMVHASVSREGLEIAGEILSDSPDAAEIAAQCRKGAEWQLSIGADVTESEAVTSGFRIVNGKTAEAPFFHVKKSVLREVSVVAVGADRDTSLKITAFRGIAFGGMNEEKSDTSEMNGSQEKQMKDNNSAAAVSDALRAERERVAEIREICGNNYPDIENEALRNGEKPAETAEKVLRAMRENRPGVNISVPVSRDADRGTLRNTVEAALCLRCGIPADSLEKSLGPRAVEYGLRETDMPLKEILQACLKIDGVSCGGSENERIRAAFSTVSLPGILSGAANKKLLQHFAYQKVIVSELCSAGDLSDFKESQRFRLTDVGDLLPVAPDGEIKDGGLLEESAKNQLETYGKKFCLTRKMIINDDLGAFMKVPAAMGNRAARLIDRLFFQRLMSNPAQSDSCALFHANHGNLITGTASALSADSLKAAVHCFLNQTDADGQPICMEPKYLLVPTSLKHTALELVRGSQMIVSGSTDRTLPALNALTDENLQVVSSPYLENSLYSGHSENAWYLFGDPRSADTFEIGFLRGKRTPTIEQGETDFNTLGMWFRVYFDIGVREQYFRGMVKCTGSAD